MSKQKKIAMQDQREQGHPAPKQCPKQYCMSWMDGLATECPYCNCPM